MRIAFQFGGGYIIFDAISQDIVIPIYYGKKPGDYICCKWYKMKWVSGVSINSIRTPLIYFCNGEMCIFGNDISKMTYKFISPFGKSMLDMYRDWILDKKYTDDFTQYLIWKTDDKYDKDITYLEWRLGNKNTIKKADGGKKLICTTDGTHSRMELFIKYLQKTFTERYIWYIRYLASQLNLNDKIRKFKFGDPRCNRSDYESVKVDEKVLDLGCNAINYYVSDKTSYQTASYDTQNKSDVKYTPFIFLMNKDNQKILFVHELVHTKIGADHSHDKYFWYLLQVYTGLPKSMDCAWTQEIEDNDTAEYDKSHTKKCNDLIKWHSQLDDPTKW